MDVKALLGKRIKEFRVDKGLTQAQLAEKIGIDDKHLSNIERGKNMPNPNILESIAEIFGVEIKDLFEFKHLKNSDEVKKELIDIINNLESRELVLAYKYIRTFVMH